MPSGKLGAEPTIMMVLGLLHMGQYNDQASTIPTTWMSTPLTHIALFIHFASACLVFSSTGTTCSFTPKYCEAFQKAACAEEAITLSIQLIRSESHGPLCKVALTSQAV